MKSIWKSTFLVVCLWPISALAQTSSPDHAKPIPAASQPFGSSCPYPEAAKNKGEQGTVVASYHGTYDGSFDQVTIIESSGSADLDRATADCIKHWHFDADGPLSGDFLKTKNGFFEWSLSTGADGSRAGVGKFLGLPHYCTNYPPDEYKSGIGGTTVLSFVVGAEGNVSNVKVAQSSGNNDLDEAATNCATRRRYIPAVQNGKPVAVPWRAKVTWSAPSQAALSPPAK
ncbi:MAG: energy transducer TonB [Rhizomicrobium sp.]